MFNCSIAKHSHSLFSFISFRVFVSTELKLYADTLIKAYILYNHTTNRAIIKTRNMNISIQAKRYSWLFVGIYNVVIPYSFNCIEALKFAHALSVSTFLILWICIGWAKCVKTLITVPWFMLVLIVFFSIRSFLFNLLALLEHPFATFQSNFLSKFNEFDLNLSSFWTLNTHSDFGEFSKFNVWNLIQ